MEEASVGAGDVAGSPRGPGLEERVPEDEDKHARFDVSLLPERYEAAPQVDGVVFGRARHDLIAARQAEAFLWLWVDDFASAGKSTLLMCPDTVHTWRVKPRRCCVKVEGQWKGARVHLVKKQQDVCRISFKCTPISGESYPWRLYLVHNMPVDDPKDYITPVVEIRVLEPSVKFAGKGIESYQDLYSADLPVNPKALGLGAHRQIRGTRCGVIIYVLRDGKFDSLGRTGQVCSRLRHATTKMRFRCVVQVGARAWRQTIIYARDNDAKGKARSPCCGAKRMYEYEVQIFG